MSLPPESAPPEDTAESTSPGEGSAASRKLEAERELGDLALYSAVVSWVLTSILLAVLFFSISGYRAGLTAKLLGLMLVLCPAVASIVFGGVVAVRGRAVGDRRTIAKGAAAIVSGVVLAPVTLCGFYFFIVYV